MIDPTNPFCYSAIASSIIVPRGNVIFLGVAHRCPAQVYLPIFDIMLVLQVLLRLIDKLHQIRSKWNKINWLYLPPFQKVQIFQNMRLMNWEFWISEAKFWFDLWSTTKPLKHFAFAAAQLINQCGAVSERAGRADRRREKTGNNSWINEWEKSYFPRHALKTQRRARTHTNCRAPELTWRQRRQVLGGKPGSNGVFDYLCRQGHADLVLLFSRSLAPTDRWTHWLALGMQRAARRGCSIFRLPRQPQLAFCWAFPISLVVFPLPVYVPYCCSPPLWSSPSFPSLPSCAHLSCFVFKSFFPSSSSTLSTVNSSLPLFFFF